VASPYDNGEGGGDTSPGITQTAARIVTYWVFRAAQIEPVGPGWKVTIRDLLGPAAELEKAAAGQINFSFCQGVASGQRTRLRRDLEVHGAKIRTW